MFCGFCLLESHVKRAVDGPRGVVAPLDLNRNLRLISKSLRPGRQEDAHEFLRRLVEACLGNPKEATNPGNFLTSLLGGKFRSRITCTVCHSNSDTFDPFMDVSLEVAGGLNSISDCLKRFTSVEVLSGQNGYKCKSCDRKVTANKQFSLETLPPVLTLQLKRFDFSQRKLHRKISFPIEINIAPFTSSPSSNPVLYDLCGVVVHAGGSLNSGHYFAYVKSPSGVWLRADDECVDTVSVNEVLSQSTGAYVLFYQARVPPKATKLQQASPAPIQVVKPGVSLPTPPSESTSPGSTEEEPKLVLNSFPSGVATAPEISDTDDGMILEETARRDARHVTARLLEGRDPRKVAHYRAICKLMFGHRMVPHIAPKRYRHLVLCSLLKGSRSLRRPHDGSQHRDEEAHSGDDRSAEAEETAIAQTARPALGSTGLDVSCWSDQDEEPGRVSSFQPISNPVVRSDYDADYDKSAKLSHKPKAAKFESEFDGRALFDHAQQFNKKRKDFLSYQGRGGSGRPGKQPKYHQ